MCGITGIIGLGADLTANDRALTRELAGRLHHRGPDSRGFFDAPRVSLGNTRLSVLDPSPAADLPMQSPDGQVILAYNGEVTNFRELRRDYGLDRTWNFRTSGDTEVLLALYDRFGIDFLGKLTGMFAFCLVDLRLKKAWLVRDFFGIRPLFFLVHQDPIHGGRLTFGSEIKALIDIPGFSTELDHEGLWDFFTLAYIPGDHTPFACVRELQGSELLEVDLTSGRWQRRPYYELQYRPDYSWTEREAADALFWQMRDSVRRNLVSDARLGLTLSGGYDTSTILALSRDLMPDAEIHTWSIRMAEASYDESGYQQLMAKHSRTVHHEISVGPRDVIDAFVQHLAFLDEPSGNGAAVPSFILAREATKHDTVLLSGEGGDETFNAYETHVASKVRRLYRAAMPRFARKTAHFAAHHLPVRHNKLSFDFLAKRFTEGAERGVVDSHLYWRHTFPEHIKAQLMPDLARTRPTWQGVAPIYDAMAGSDPLDRISALDIRTYFIADLMVKNDRTFMAHSIEGRFPYMDRLLLEFAQTIPPGLRIKGLRRRYMQKRAMKRLMPKPIQQRGNFGLEMPHSTWFAKELRDFAEGWLTRERIAALGFIDPDVALRLWQEHLARKVDHGRGLWSLLNLVVWHELYVRGGGWRAYLPSYELS